MSKRLAGKVALISGGTRGIGLAMARAMLAEGADVMIASRKQDGVDAALAELESQRTDDWGRLRGRTAHVGEAAACADLVATTEAQLGVIDVLVNNAGTNPFFGPMLNISEVAFDKTFEVNLKSAWRLSVAISKKLMAEKRPGSIINVSSVLGKRAAPFQGVYAMTKASMISMTETFAIELGGAGIRVNAIAPGPHRHEARGRHHQQRARAEDVPRPHRPSPRGPAGRRRPARRVPRLGRIVVHHGRHLPGRWWLPRTDAQLGAPPQPSASDRSVTSSRGDEAR
jgi:NAD(P)-dependent dehydrogenase (short-subunit alcohol dehydrogenase family)